MDERNSKCEISKVYDIWVACDDIINYFWETEQFKKYRFQNLLFILLLPFDLPKNEWMNKI